MQNSGDDEVNSQKPRILCIADTDKWIFNRHIQTLDRYLDDDFIIEKAYRNEPYDEDAHDLIYPLEYNMVRPEQIKNPNKYVTGIRSFIAWADWDFLVLVNFLVTHFRSVHVVSKQLYEIFSPYLSGLQYVTHGVDTDFFKPESPPNSESGHLRLGWSGDRRNFLKGYRDFIEPLGKIPGVELVICGLADRYLSYDEMTGFYNSIDVYVCASSFEGNNNPLLEAASMERAIITTPTGTAPEYLQNGHNALIVDRIPGQFEKAVIRLRDNPSLRIWLGQQARKSLIEGGWDWKIKAEGYRLFFLNALQQSEKTAVDLLVIEPENIQHYAQVLHNQFLLERELRIGHAIHELELESELKAIKRSKTYQLVERIKSTRIFNFLLRLYQRYENGK